MIADGKVILSDGTPALKVCGGKVWCVQCDCFLGMVDRGKWPVLAECQENDLEMCAAMKALVVRDKNEPRKSGMVGHRLTGLTPAQRNKFHG